MKILMTGATGFIGKNLGLHLAKKGHELIIVTRNSAKAKMICPFPCHTIEVDLTHTEIPSNLLEPVDAIINLMGESLSEGSWSGEKKQAFYTSRVTATKNLRNSYKTMPPKVYVGTSAIGFYGDRDSEELNEESPAGRGFLSELCQAWEKEHHAFSELGSRVVIPRIGIVLSQFGGALAEMLPIFRSGIGAPVATGRQWMSWIHLVDLISIFEQSLLIENINGPINAVSSQPSSNEVFSKQLAQVLAKPLWPATPAFMIRLLFGEKSSLLLSSQKVLSTKLESIGIKIQHTDLVETLKHELQNLCQNEDIQLTYQYVPAPLEQVFPFFADAKNLEKITPELLQFKIESMSTPEIQKGTLIDYTLKIHGVPIKWKTEIQTWNPPNTFVDNQLQGPYELWHHTHSFEKLGAGTLMTDRVRYRMPLGQIGWLASFWKVKKDINEIFNHRRRVIGKVFPS